MDPNLGFKAPLQPGESAFQAPKPPTQQYTVQQMAGAVRQKFPGVYDDKSDSELTSAWVKKYPVYASQVKPEVSYGQRVEATQSAAADETAGAYKGAAESVIQDTKNYAQENQGKALPEQVLNALTYLGHLAGTAAGTTAKVGAAVGKTIAAPVTAMGEDGDTLGDQANEALKPVGDYLSQGAQNVGAAHPKIVDFLHQNPDVAQGIMDLVNTAGLTGAGKVLGSEVSSPGAALAEMKTSLSSGVSSISDFLNAPAEQITSRAATHAESGGLLSTLRAKSATGDIPVFKGTGNVSSQAETSARRLADQAVPGGVGAAIRPKPLDMYNEFVSQEEKHLADIKADPAISKVGSEIGDAYDQVVKMRREVGKELDSGLESFKGSSIQGHPLNDFSHELSQNGVSLHRGEDGLELLPSQVSKFSSQDITLLEKYASEVDKLGKNPTAEQVDAFVSRMPNEIKGLKSSLNIKFKTNAERLIGNNLQKLRSGLENAGPKEYVAARKGYADLSKFLDEGAKFLGAKTQTGDYARDASIAKSAVQSVLNNGKKDWLVKLEGLTGYPALDRATLALQAMKDSGDFKGNSLLDLLTEGAEGATGSPSGLVGKIVGFLGNKASSAIAGSKVDQTRAFLETLGRKK